MRPPPTHVIETANAAALPALLALLDAAGLPQDGFADHIGNALLVRNGDVILGCAALEIYGSAALLRSVAVAPPQGRPGRATRHRGADAGRRSPDPPRLPAHRNRRRLLPPLRFRPHPPRDVDPAVKQSVEFTSACPQSAVVMEKKMNDE
ncbi:MAG: hypothetical protein R2873_05425 [Caldilineaceae bacterium]